MIAIVLRMADCQARSSQTDLAVKSYHLAEKLAAQTGQPKLESVADVNEAALQAKTGKLNEALRLYQQALQLDRSIGDDGAKRRTVWPTAAFWMMRDFPPRLAYACMVKSERMTQIAAFDSPVPEPRSGRSREPLEKRLGSDGGGGSPRSGTGAAGSVGASALEASHRGHLPASYEPIDTVRILLNN